jgi:two-component system LytT family sensor kinase
MNDRFFQWLLKYRVFYITGWLLVSFLLVFARYDRQTPVFPQWVGFALITAAAYPICRYTAYTLVPRLLYRHHILKFILCLLLLPIINAVFTYLFAGLAYHLVSGNPMFRSLYYFTSISSMIWLIDIILISITSIIKIISDRYFMEHQMAEIEKEKIGAELNFLRGQINPHFLFNIMNTIYFQIDKTNAEARLSIEKFSEMLRYQLYECTTDKIQLSKELNYIKNYIAIQTLRMEKESDIQLNIQEPGRDFWIAPFLILPIIENAFKHVSSFKDASSNKIHISLKAGDDTFFIEVINSYESEQGAKHLLSSGGLGIQNLKRRLELLYPGKHDMAVEHDKGTYKTTLNLKYGS